MRKKALTIFLVIFLAGCATTKKGQDVQSQELRNRISYLEAELKKKNQQLDRLEVALESQQARRTSKVKVDTARQMSIRQMQTALKSAGFYKGSVDGKTGTQTKQAIKEFQKANGLKADGIAGRQTLEKLRRYLN